MEPVPPWKDDAVVGIGLVLPLRMVNAMHSRRDEEFIEVAFEPNRQPNVAMMKKCVGLKHQFISHKGWHRNSNQRDLDNAEGGGHEDFAKVESEAGGDVEIRIKMVDVVKSPEKGNPMVGDMPPVEAEVEQE